MTQRFLILIALSSFMGCSGNPEKVTFDETQQRGQFLPAAVASKTVLLEGAECTKELQDMDKRLRPGLTYTVVNTNKSASDTTISVSTEVEAIKSVDHDRNTYTFSRTHTTKNMVGWIEGKKQYTFGEGFAGSSIEITSVSPNFKPILIHSQKPKPEEWTSCSVMNSNIPQPTLENGIYVLESQRRIPAQKQESVQTGILQCSRYKSLEGQAPQLLETKVVGPGKITSIRIYTNDEKFPSPGILCGGIGELYSKDETLSDDGSVHILRGEELVGGRF